MFHSVQWLQFVSIIINFIQEMIIFFTYKIFDHSDKNKSTLKLVLAASFLMESGYPVPFHTHAFLMMRRQTLKVLRPY